MSAYHYCAICIDGVDGLRPRQIEPGGPAFLICRECDERDPVTLASRPPRIPVAPRNGGGWQRRVYHPLDEMERDLAFRILRAVRHFDWVSSTELCDVLHIPGVSEDRVAHNTFSVALSRLARGGFLRRRPAAEWSEYQITRLGLARIENHTRCSVEPKRSIAA